MSEFDHFVGTRPVSGQHTIDLDALSTWLDANLPALVEAMVAREIERITKKG